MKQTFVLVHGAWHGGWCWQQVAQQLRAQGHQVYTPTLTGLADRAHLLTERVDMNLHVQDICSLIEYEDLQQVVLVGHSYGGAVITGVADRLKSRLAQLIYLDASFLNDGQSLADLLPPHIAAERLKPMDEQGLRMALPAPEKMGVTDPQLGAWLTSKLTPHPLRSYKSPITLQHPTFNGVPKSYIAVTQPWYEPFAALREGIKQQITQDPAIWRWRELATGHDAMILAPQALTDCLLELVSP